MIARKGFAGCTMRMVAEEAGVSTGMLNHYFANRQELLTQALVFVSIRTQERYRKALDGIPPGIARLRALLDSALGEDEEMIETWRVWMHAFGEAVRLQGLRHTIEGRLQSWYEIIDHALEGIAPPDTPGRIPWSWRFDAVLNGLALQALTSEAVLDGRQIRDEVIWTLFPDLLRSAEVRAGGDERLALGG